MFNNYAKLVLAYTPGWNDPPSYSFEDSTSAQQENRPKIFDRIPARVLPNSSQVSQQSNLDISQLPMDNNISSNVASDSIAPSSSIICDIPIEQRLTYVMTSLNESIKNSTLSEVIFII